VLCVLNRCLMLIIVMLCSRDLNVMHFQDVGMFIFVTVCLFVWWDDRMRKKRKKTTKKRKFTTFEKETFTK
jgi:hypothetical protein